MGKIIAVLGGARSGKSSFAAQLVTKKSGKVAFVATCLPLDQEMKTRVKLHRASRSPGWKTFEETKDLGRLFETIKNSYDVIVLDCLTLWLSNLLLKGYPENRIRHDLESMLEGVRAAKASLIIVSNEVGLGIVPEHALGRLFRDLAGRMNQLLTQRSDDVYFVVAGLPWRIKKNGRLKKDY